MEKKTAERKFEQAKKRGDTAIITRGITRTSILSTVYTRIGNMHPDTEIIVEFSILQRVDQPQPGQWELKIPSELRPLYPVGLSDICNYCLEDSDLFHFFKDVSKRKGGKDKGVILNEYKLQSGGYPWDIEVLIASNNDLFDCESPTHSLIREESPMKGVQKYIIDPTKPQLVSKSFIFTFKDPEYKVEDLTIARWDENKVAPYAFNLFIDPESQLDEVGSWNSDMEDSILNDLKAEFLFLIDRSGSMSGKPIQLAREALVYSNLYLRPAPLM